MKYVPLKKRSKKAQKEYHDRLRSSWGEIVPMTRMIPDKTKYARSRVKREEQSLRSVED